jgi:hypothetical protein
LMIPIAYSKSSLMTGWRSLVPVPNCSGTGGLENGVIVTGGISSVYGAWGLWDGDEGPPSSSPISIEWVEEDHDFVFESVGVTRWAWKYIIR